MPYPDPWPAGQRGAVSLTFDDGTPDQLRDGVPRLDARGLQGTFYLPTGGDWQQRLAPWATALATGHELGNHSVGHTCSENFANDPQPRGLESLTLADLEADLLECERRLTALFGPLPAHSFAYPCYQTDVGRGAGRQSYVPLVARHFVAGRGGGEAGFHNHPYHVDLHCVAGLTCQQLSGAEMIGLCERAARQGRWAVLVFHGLQVGRLGTALNEFEELLDYLADQRARLWCAPLATVAGHLREQRAAVGLT
ncbi:MAG: polysaccharide deacetylase family protein [Fimbriimonadaceae bacterium]|nr:polysaccharide deacetylase family protein [Fimbriimonadaceae bacterium]